MLKPLIALPLLIGGSLQAADPQEAKALVDQHCYQCHGTELYTRPDRKVQSLEGLQRQVKRCELALGLKWFDEEIAAVTDYLNTEYYKFK
jgi:mono/diheme cytochrome c family protein